MEDPKRLWRARKIPKNRAKPRLTHIAAIKTPQGTLTDSESIAEALRGAFFPPIKDADLSDLDGFEYSDPIPMPSIKKTEILAAANHLSSNKAPGPDETANEIYKFGLFTDKYAPRTDSIWLDRLTSLFNGSLDLGHCPSHFRDSITIALKKPHARDLSAIKSYRPIALLNTIGKLMEAVLAERIQYLFATEDILPPTHLGGKKGISCEVALFTVLDAVYRGWQKGKCMAALSLDISGAFNNVSHARLLHNLRKRGVGAPLLTWIASFLTDRTTLLKLPDYTGATEPINVGIPQGSPLSPALYIVFNADLVEHLAELGTTIAWIDDTTIVVEGDTFEDVALRLQEASSRCKLWSTRHAAVFDPRKFQLIYFRRPGSPRNPPAGKRLL